MIATVTVIAEAADNFLMGFFGANIFISILFMGILTYIWGLINTLQIIILTYLLNIDIPENLAIVMKMVLKLLSLEMIPTDDIFEEMFAFRETEVF